MLHDDWNVGYNYARIIRATGNGLWLGKIVKSLVKRAACRHDEKIRADRFPIFKENRDFYARIFV